MASQVAHIVYAKKYFDRVIAGELKAGVKLDRDEFLLGCIFPDIRRIDPSIKRKDTHLKFYPLDLDFQNLTSFEAGWKFHLYCDMRREDILKKYEFYSDNGTGKFHELASKILEDELAYENYNNWEKIVNYFNRPPFPKIEKPSVSVETFRLWYAIVSKYIQEKPNDKTMRIFLSKQPELVDHIDTIIKSVDALRENKKAAKVLGRIWEEII